MIFGQRNLNFEWLTVDYVIILNEVNILMEKQDRVPEECCSVPQSFGGAKEETWRIHTLLKSFHLASVLGVKLFHRKCEVVS